MHNLRLFFQKWIAFFRPLAGWADRLRNVKAGKNTWEVPGKPECPKVCPFPVQWVPHRLELLPEDDDATHTRGFAFLPTTCVDTGEDCEVGVAVLCCRCGVPLHPRAANMFGGFDPPYCKRCKWPIKLL